MTFTKDQAFNPNVPSSVAGLTSPTLFTATSDPVSTNHPSKYYVGFIEDDWKARSNVTVTFGLRYERLYGPLNEDLNPADFPSPFHTSTSASAGTRTIRPTDRRRVGRERRRQDRRANRLRHLLRPRPHARRFGRIPQLPSSVDHDHKSRVSGSVPRTRPPQVHRCVDGAEPHDRG